MLNGVRIAGKTGTTNAHRDAWFVAFTGNYVAGIWFGNDDYQSMQRMTGGSLPAMTWQAIMTYAHQGVEVRDISGAPSRTRRRPTSRSSARSPSPPTRRPVRARPCCRAAAPTRWCGSSA